MLKRFALLPSIGLTLLIGCESASGPSVAPAPPGSPDVRTSGAAKESKLKPRGGNSPQSVGVSKD